MQTIIDNLDLIRELSLWGCGASSLIGLILIAIRLFFKIGDIFVFFSSSVGFALLYNFIPFYCCDNQKLLFLLITSFILGVIIFCLGLIEICLNIINIKTRINLANN